jgi:ABC-type multidrug transport system ATPase subunit
MYAGEIFALLGHNGAGKTTTIKMVIGLLEATSGRMVFEKKDLALNRRSLHHKIGVCP